MAGAVSQVAGNSPTNHPKKLKCDAYGALETNSSPYVVSVTPSDVTTYDPPLLGIRVGTTAGDVKVISNGSTVTIPSVQVGETIPGEITKVFSTDTAAAGITGWQRG